MSKDIVDKINPDGVPSRKERAATDAKTRDKQDIQSRIEQAGNSAKVKKQISDAKSERSAFGSPSYAKPAAKPDPVVNKIMEAKPAAKATAPASTKVVRKDVTKAPAKPAQETAASRASRQAAYDDWKSSQKALGAPGMKKGGTAKKKMACGGKAYAKGGLVKSSKAINGCASKGLTKGASR